MPLPLRWRVPSARVPEGLRSARIVHLVTFNFASMLDAPSAVLRRFAPCARRGEPPSPELGAAFALPPIAVALLRALALALRKVVVVAEVLLRELLQLVARGAAD